MLERVKIFIRKGREIPLEEWKDQFFQKIMTNPSHEWIRRESSFLRAFRILVDSFNPKAMKLVRGRENILFYPCTGVMGAAFSGDAKNHVVILYPDLLKMLKSGIFMVGIGALAHEIGHIALNHSGRNIGRVQAQMEADYFSFLLGFGEELQYFLSQHQEDHEITARLRALAKLTALEGPSGQLRRL